VTSVTIAIYFARMQPSSGGSTWKTGISTTIIAKDAVYAPRNALAMP
jgi:hypothetical protein